MCGAARLREVERPVDPALHFRVLGATRPHPRANGGLDGEACEDVGLLLGSSVSFSARFIASQKRSPSNWRALARPDLPPEAGPLVRLAELERAVESRRALVEVVAADRELGGATEPAHAASAQPLELGRARPPTRDRRPRARRPVRSGVRAAPRPRRGRRRCARASAAKSACSRARLAFGTLAVDDLARQRVLERVFASRRRATSRAGGG